MRNLARSLFAVSLLIAFPAAADGPVFVMRPAIGSGTAGIIPQNAFSEATGSGPQNPTAPGTPTSPSGDGFVFTSERYTEGRGGPDTVLSSIYNAEYDTYSGAIVQITGFPNPLTYCEIMDSQSGEKARAYISIENSQTRSDGIVVFLKPKIVGRMGITFACAGEPQALIYEVDLTVK